ncbi:MAG: short-chain dehydrogenase, partial [Chloroflexi bacterium]|nr:short-chain dehydrogenase [Chloroflexota bacterium]
ARRLQGSYVTANCLHPGTVNTRLLHDSFGRALPVPGTPEQGADTVIYLAVHPEVEGVSGQYFISRRASLPSTLALNAPLQRRFWQESARLAGLEVET